MEGYAPDQVAEAMSLAANMLLIHDAERKKDADGDKVKSTVHGASVGVHASDAANAWRNIARVSNHRNTVASILVGAYHTAGQSPHVRRERWPVNTDAVEAMDDVNQLLARTEEAVRQRDQALAAAAVERFAALGGSPRPVFDLFLKYATSEDDALASSCRPGTRLGKRMRKSPPVSTDENRVVFHPRLSLVELTLVFLKSGNQGQ